MSTPLSVAALVTLVGGRTVRGSVDRTVRGVASLEQAGPDEATFFGNAKYLSALRQTQAGVILVPADAAAVLESVGAGPVHGPNGDGAGPHPGLAVPGSTWVGVDNPTLAFSRLVDHFAPPAARFEPGVAPTARLGRGVRLGEGACVQDYVVIEDDVEIGAGSVVGAFGFVGRGTVVGEGCLFHPRVTVREGVRIGRRVIIHSGAVIGSDGFGFQPEAGRHVKIPQRGTVQIDDDVEIGANTTIDRARFGRTHVGEGTKIDNLVMIAHNVSVGPHCLLVAQAGVSGSTRLGHHVTLAGQAGVVGHVAIGDGAVVAAKTGVSKDVPAGTVVFGIPAEPLREAKETRAHVRRLPRLAARLRALEAELARLKQVLGHRD